MDEGGTAIDANMTEQESKSADDEAATQLDSDPNKLRGRLQLNPECKEVEAN